MIWTILIAGILLRVVNLNQSLWLDEATQAILSQNSIYSIIFQRDVDFHPPLSYIVMHFWIRISSSEVWLRMLSVIFGVITIGIAYKFAKELFDKKIAILSAIFLAVNPYHIYYSQEARMYSEAAFFGILSIYFLHLFLKKAKLNYSIGYILSGAALLYTHYNGFFLIFAQLLFISFIYKSRIKKFLLNLLSIFLLWLPWLPQFINQLQSGLGIDQYLPGWRNALSLPFYKALPLIFLKFTYGRIDFNQDFYSYLFALTILVLLGFIFYKSFKNFRDENYKYLLFLVFVPLTCAMILSFKIPLNQPFRLLFVLPIFSILLSLGIFNLGKNKNLFSAVLLVIFFIGLMQYYFNSKYWREDWKSAVTFIENNANINNTQVLFAWPDPFPPYKWYAKNNPGQGIVRNFPALIDDVKVNLELAENIESVYLFEYLQALSDPQKYIQAELEIKGYKLHKIYDFRGVGFIDYYVKQK